MREEEVSSDRYQHNLFKAAHFGATSKLPSVAGYCAVVECYFSQTVSQPEFLNQNKQSKNATRGKSTKITLRFSL